MKFDTLVYLNFLWFIPILVAFYIYAYRRKKVIISKFSEVETFQKLIPPLSLFKTVLKPALIILVFSLLCFTLTGPKWGYNWEDVKRSGIDIVVAVDVSKSMLSEDIKPNRLERAKREILDLIQMLQGDRIAIVAFAGVSFLECPLTLDYSAAALFLDAIDTEIIPVQGTNLGHAMETSIKAFGTRKNQSKAIILITDGEDHDEKAVEIARFAKKQGVKIYTIGVGASDGAPIPNEDGGFKKDSSGKVIVSKLNEKLLKELALETGAAYVRSVSGDMDLEEIYLKEIKATMEGADLQTSRRKIWEERFQIFLLIALFLLVLEFFLTTKKGAIRGIFKLGGFLLIFISNQSYALNLDSKIIDALDLYENKKYEESLKLFNDSLLKKPEDSGLHYNIGQNYYKLQEYQKAIDSYTLSALNSKDQVMEENSFHKIGNSYFKMGKLEEAAQTYRKVLDLNPEHKAAKKNLAITLREIKKRMKEEKKTQEKCENKRKENKENKKDQQKKESKQDQQSDKEKQNQPGQEQKQQEEEKKNQQGENNSEKNEKKEEKGGQEAQKQEYVPYKMSEKEAKKWLESLDEKENRKKHKMQMMPAERYSNEKDW